MLSTLLFNLCAHVCTPRPQQDSKICRWHQHRQPYTHQVGRNSLAEWWTENHLLLSVSKTKISVFRKKKKGKYSYLSTSVELRWSRWAVLGSWESMSPTGEPLVKFLKWGKQNVDTSSFFFYTIPLSSAHLGCIFTPTYIVICLLLPALRQKWPGEYMLNFQFKCSCFFLKQDQRS